MDWVLIYAYTSIMFKDEKEKREYFANYRREKECRISLSFRKGKDDDIIDFWTHLTENKQELIRNLIRQEMERRQE